MDVLDRDHPSADALFEGSSDHPDGSAAGHCQPPVPRRFKAGKSGNPRGRPRGSKNRKTIMKEVASETYLVTEDDRQRRRSVLELMVLKLRNMAADGNVRAFRAFKALEEKFEPREAEGGSGCLVVPAPLTPEEWLAEAEKANAKAVHPSQRSSDWAR